MAEGLPCCVIERYTPVGALLCLKDPVALWTTMMHLVRLVLHSDASAGLCKAAACIHSMRLTRLHQSVTFSTVHVDVSELVSKA